MKRILLSLILGLSFTGAISAMEIPQLDEQEEAQRYPSRQNWMSALSGSIKCYGLLYAGTYLHELGHAIALKTLLNKDNVSISINPFLPVSGETNAYLSPQEMSGWRVALTSLAGPIFGIAGYYGILKANSIFTEYYKNKKTFLAALKAGLRSPLFNENQDLAIQLVASHGIMSDIQQLVPSSKVGRDGNLFLNSLGLANPAQKYPFSFLALDSVCFASQALLPRYLVNKRIIPKDLQ